MASGLIDKGLYGFGRGIGLSKEDVDNGVAAFTHYDKDGSGAIDVNELKNIFRSFHKNSFDISPSPRCLTLCNPQK